MTERFGNSIFTYTGNVFYPLDPRQQDIYIEDIAHALSLMCRFNGHINCFLSVAQHSIHVSELCKPENALYGLLHDASEAYLADVPSPLKQMFDDYKNIERKVQGAICAKFNLDPLMPPDVKVADNIMLATEMRDLMTKIVIQSDFEPRPERIEPFSSVDAEKKFMDRFLFLTGK